MRFVDMVRALGEHDRYQRLYFLFKNGKLLPLRRDRRTFNEADVEKLRLFIERNPEILVTKKSPVKYKN